MAPMREIMPRFSGFGDETWFRRMITRLDWSLFAASLFLAGIGLLFIYSATQGGPEGTHLTRQLTALFVGVTGMLILTALPYQIWQTYAHWLYAIGVVALILVLVFGVRLRGSRSWFDLHVFYFQPIELVRLCLAIMLAAYADSHFKEMRSGRVLVAPMAFVGLYLMLVLAQPDLSSAMVLAPMGAAVLFSAGASISVLLAFLLMGFLALGIPLASTYFFFAGERFAEHWLWSLVQRAFLEGPAFWTLWGGVSLLVIAGWWFLRKLRFDVTLGHLLASLSVMLAGVGGSFVVKAALKEYQRKRLIAFIDPMLDPLGAGYNILQSEIAIGAGRFFGRGYLSGSQSQLGFLPERHTDFIFALLAEETGFFGAMFLLGLYFWVVWRAFDIAASARDRFGRFLAVGIGAYLGFSAVVNMGMVMGLMPVTGLPLPFLSYGGSSLVGVFLAIGLLLSIHWRRYAL